MDNQTLNLVSFKFDGGHPHTQLLTIDAVLSGVTSIASDSRNVKKNSIFVAIKGTQTNGMDYIPSAIANGANVIICEEAEQAQAILAQHGLIDGVSLVQTDNARKALAILAHYLAEKNNPSAHKPNMIAVTGTNGKSSVVDFYRQIMGRVQAPAASLGTIGLRISGMALPQALTPYAKGGLTTPDPVDLAHLFSDLSKHGMRHIALEASSHGLDQYRLDGIGLSAAAFTNLSHDHLDYHGTMEAYRQAKYRLFEELLPQGGTIIVKSGTQEASDFAKIAKQRDLKMRLVEMMDNREEGAEVQLLDYQPTLHASTLTMRIGDFTFTQSVPLVGYFQLENLVMACALAFDAGVTGEEIAGALSYLEPISGRLERIDTSIKQDSAIYVDYAHSPHALSTVLEDIRPHCKGKLHLVFGCGGDRDRDKRPIMGQIAHEKADHVIVTDDNPRFEAPETIRAAILQTCPNATQIADRTQAIHHAIKALQPQDCLIVAGKGHEQGQIINGEVIDYSDHDAILQFTQVTEVA